MAGGEAVVRGIFRIIEVGGTAIHKVGAAITSAAQHQVKNSWRNAEKVTVSSYSSDPSSHFTPEQEFQTHLDHHHHVSDHLVFGSAPTQPGVVEATSDFQDTIKQNVTSVSCIIDNQTVSSSFQSVYDNPDSVEVSNFQESKGTSFENLVNRVEPELDQDNDKKLHISGHSNVFEAFNLLQSNPSIQGIVASLASDKAVWDAMLKNEKVLEFKQSLLEGEFEVSDADKRPCDHKNPLTEVIKNMKVKAVEYTQKITEVCNKFSGFADAFLEKDGDFVERALKASSIVGIGILLILLFKRV
ncbi:hypothetical protein KI387_018198 [Taxus chinensis]|uniref:Uncharacterized protein n=1 Tax=Taxus chinensis TaxID=29808 RepID=A0AA38GHD0_TAXCH|nr:hypothetical protein KI387_018198 [Taxus chinensis]